MAYVNQVDAAIAMARGQIAHAKNRADAWPRRGIVLVRAFEFAASAVLMAWGDPHKADAKLHDYFNNRVGPLIDRQHAHVVRAVWANECQVRSVDDVVPLLAACEQTVEYLVMVAKSAPPAGWEVPPVREPVGWAGLPEDTRVLLRDAQARARVWSPGMRIMLFGSRAAGRALPDSDYDLLLIFPDDVPEQHRRCSRGDVIMLGKERGTAIDIVEAAATEWENPEEVSVPLVKSVRTCGIVVPD
jgi:hypothetical protein